MSEDLSKVAFVVEATHCERYFLWTRKGERLQWQPATSGRMTQIGQVRVCDNDGVSNASLAPITLTMSIEDIMGAPVLFWEATSQVVDYHRVTEWLTQNVPAYAAGCHCDAMNFPGGFPSRKYVPDK